MLTIQKWAQLIRKKKKEIQSFEILFIFNWQKNKKKSNLFWIFKKKRNPLINFFLFFYWGKIIKRNPIFWKRITKNKKSPYKFLFIFNWRKNKKKSNLLWIFKKQGNPFIIFFLFFIGKKIKRNPIFWNIKFCFFTNAHASVKGFFWKVFITFTKEDRFSWRRKPPGNVFLDQFKEQNVPNKMTCLIFKISVR